MEAEKDGIQIQYGKGDAYKPGEEKEINTDIILYAQWENFRIMQKTLKSIMFFIAQIIIQQHFL